MATNYLTPNMNLVVPVVGQEPGPNWGNDLNSSLTTIDLHNHSPGYGVQINPAGININADLGWNGYNATTLRSVRFSPQSSNISASSDIGCLYESGVDLWYNDGSGNQVRITSGGAVNATSSGISSGTASASFVAGVLVVNAASTTPANIQAASLLLGNNSSGTDYVTLSPHGSLASNYTLTLPLIPASTSFVTLDTSGNLSGSIATSQGITASNIANGTITTTQIASQTIAQGNLALRATGTSVAAGGVAVSASTGTFNNNSSSPATAATCTITTTGRPVFVGVTGDNSNLGSFIAVSGGVIAEISIYNGSNPLTRYLLGVSASTPPGSIYFIDFPAAGTYTYTLQAYVNIATSSLGAEIYQCALVAYEL